MLEPSADEANFGKNKRRLTELWAQQRPSEIGEWFKLISHSLDREAFVELVCEMENKSFEVYLPILCSVEFANEAVANLVPIVEETIWEYHARVHNPHASKNWPALDDEVARTVIEAGGIVTDEWAFCQTLEANEKFNEIFDEIKDSMETAGYSMVNFRPYLADGKTQTAILWKRGRCQIRCRIRHDIRWYQTKKTEIMIEMDSHHVICKPTMVRRPTFIMRHCGGQGSSVRPQPWAAVKHWQRF